jgi:phosphate transport system protein
MNETRKSYHQELDDIRASMVKMAASVVELIPRGTMALLDGDLEAADYIILADDEFNVRAVELEERCYRVVALQQPMAVDLRRLMAAVRMIGEIERSADLVVNICKAARRIYGHPLDPRLRGLISEMSDTAQQLFRFAVDAYAESDGPLAAALDDMDDNLDKSHAMFISAIFESHKEGRIELPDAVQLALVGRFYERIGDHAVNIGERVVYMVTGVLEDRERSTAPPGAVPPAAGG